MNPKCNKKIQRKIFKYTKIYKIINMQITKQLKEKIFSSNMKKG